MAKAPPTPQQLCAKRLAEAKEALHLLSTGQNVVSIGYGERRVQYSSLNIDNLRQYIAQLEAECGNCAAGRRRPYSVSF